MVRSDTTAKLSAEWMANVVDRQLGRSEGTVQAQPTTQEPRRDGADNALPKLDMITARARRETNAWRWQCGRSLARSAFVAA